jgi:hypothetical protein
MTAADKSELSPTAVTKSAPCLRHASGSRGTRSWCRRWRERPCVTLARPHPPPTRPQKSPWRVALLPPREFLGGEVILFIARHRRVAGSFLKKILGHQLLKVRAGEVCWGCAAERGANPTGYCVDRGATCCIVRGWIFRLGMACGPNNATGGSRGRCRWEDWVLGSVSGAFDATNLRQPCGEPKTFILNEYSFTARCGTFCRNRPFLHLFI